MPEQSKQGRDEDNSAPRSAAGAAAAPGLAPDTAPDTSKKLLRSKMVDWYDPVQLVQTGIRVVISTTLGRNADYRMIEAIAHSGDRLPFFDHASAYAGRNEGDSADHATPREQKDFWIDYAADVGDGFNPTYAVAFYLAQPGLTVKTAESGVEHRTHRGDILIFGGDAVYPTASRQAYDERLVRPYKAALRFTDEPHPHVYAIPGNHDWYDNLVSFTRLFTTGRRFAGWRTRQSRSYFALKLPFGWWLLGPDVQLGSDIDGPQVAYFKEVAGHIRESDRIILCNAEPYWIKEAMYSSYDEEVYNQSNLRFLEEKVLGRKISVFISGDFHHYRRHEGKDGDQKITAGGGGAFLHPTHGPDVSELAGGFQLKKCFPDEKTSRKLCWNNFKFPFMHKRFAGLSGFIYLLTAWITLVNLESHKADGLRQAVRLMSWSLVENPFGLFWAAAVFAGFYLFTDTHSKAYRYIAGSIHGLAHILGAFAIGWLAYFTAFISPSPSLPALAQYSLAGALIFVSGAFVGSLIMGAYLFVSLNLFGRHSNEAFSSLACEDYKNFLRLKIEPSGALTIFPIGVRRVARRWKERPEGASGPELVPDDPKATAPELIEEPIRIKP